MNWRFDDAQLSDFDPVPAAAAQWFADITDDSHFDWQPSSHVVIVGACPKCGETIGRRRRGVYGIQCRKCRAKLPYEELEVEEEEQIRGQWHGDGEGLLILGAVGVGKTHLAAALFNEFGTFGVATDWESGTDLAWQARLAIGQDNGADPYHEAADFPGVVVIDDIGAIKYVTASGEPTHAHDGIAHVLRHRYDYLMPTILTAHQSLSKLAEHVGIGIASRLQQMSRVELEGTDRRTFMREAVEVEAR